MATCVDVAGAKLSGGVPRPSRSSRWKAGACCPALDNQPIQRDAIYWEHEGNAAIRVGDWKLVRLGRDGPWELYDLKTDRTELHDLAAAEPQLRRRAGRQMGRLGPPRARQAVSVSGRCRDAGPRGQQGGNLGRRGDDRQLGDSTGAARGRVAAQRKRAMGQTARRLNRRDLFKVGTAVAGAALLSPAVVYRAINSPVGCGRSSATI